MSIRKCALQDPSFTKLYEVYKDRDAAARAVKKPAWPRVI